MALEISNIASYDLWSMQRCQIPLMGYIVEFLLMHLFAPDCSYLSYVFLQVGKKIKSLLSRVWKFCGSISQNFAILITNEIRKVRQGVNIFDKRILEYCILHLEQIVVQETDLLMVTLRTRFNRKNSHLSDGFGYLIKEVNF